jgi:prepilin-type processing-associated H-X9-DG protein
VGEPLAQITQDITAFVTNLNKGKAVDFTTMQRFISGVRQGYFGANEWWPKVSKNLPGKLVIDKMTVGDIQGKSASVTLEHHWALDAQATDAMKAQFQTPRTEILALQLGLVPYLGPNGEDIWQIVPPATEAEAGKHAEMGGFIAYLALNLAQKITTAPESKLGARSLSHMKQLGLGVLQFVQDYDERYAFAPEYLQEAIFPYIQSKDLFLIPNVGTPYSFNSNLSDKGIAVVRNLTRTVMFYEGENEQPVLRYGGKAAIGFTDGHAALLTPEELKTVIWVP